MCRSECDKCYDKGIEIKSDWGIRKGFIEKLHLNCPDRMDCISINGAERH